MPRKRQRRVLENDSCLRVYETTFYVGSQTEDCLRRKDYGLRVAVASFVIGAAIAGILGNPKAREKLTAVSKNFTKKTEIA